MEREKEFIGCHNLGRVSSMNNYIDLQQSDQDLDAIENESLLRYMIDVVYNCVHNLPTAQKLEMYESFRRGEEYPDISHLPQTLFMDIKSTLKSIDDLKIPAEQAEVHKKANSMGSRFRATFEKFKAKLDSELEEASKGINIMGINLNKMGGSTKLIYVVAIVSIFAFLFKIAIGTVFKEDKTNPKHQPEKRRSRQERKKKAKTT
jgi:hypothetical protein